MMSSGRKPFLSQWQVALVVLALTLVIFGGAIWIISRHVQGNVREQIIQRDGRILHAVVQMLQPEARDGTEVSPDDPAEQLGVILKSSRLKGVMAIRLYGRGGEFIASFPPAVREAAISEEDRRALFAFQPVSYFYPSAEPGELFWSDKSPFAAGYAAPLLVTTVPLHRRDESRLLGLAQFIIDGQMIAAEFTALDRQSAIQGTAIFVSGSALLILAMGWAFHRLRRANRLLRLRSENLLAANQELALVRKTSAVGVLASHVFHELKSRLFGLQGVLSVSAPTARQRELAAETVRDMQQIIQKTTEMLRDEEGTVLHYEVSLEELGRLLQERVRRQAESAGVRLHMDAGKSGTLSSRVANLIVIILQHLVENAVQATPRKKNVRVSLEQSGENVVCTVRDEGSGFSTGRLKLLFHPVPSAKEGGSGIGLALSKQLANSLDAELELQETGDNGSVFVLKVPMRSVGHKSRLDLQTIPA